jgi:hypothetical protein
MYLGHDEDRVNARKPKTNWDLIAALAATLLVWVLLGWSIVAKADHKGPAVEVGDYAAPIMVCMDVQAAATFFRVAYNGVGEFTPEQIELFKEKCGLWEQLVNRIKPKFRVASIIAEFTADEGHHVAFVRYAPIEGAIFFGTTTSKRIFKKGVGNGRRTHRR